MKLFQTTFLPNLPEIRTFCVDYEGIFPFYRRGILSSWKQRRKQKYWKICVALHRTCEIHFQQMSSTSSSGSGEKFKKQHLGYITYRHCATAPVVWINRWLRTWLNTRLLEFGISFSQTSTPLYFAILSFCSYSILLTAIVRSCIAEILPNLFGRWPSKHRFGSGCILSSQLGNSLTKELFSPLHYMDCLFE